MAIPQKYRKRKNIAEMSSMSKILRLLRLQAGYSQETVSKILGVNRSTYSYIELSHTKPQFVYLEKLAKLYKVDMSFFFRTDFDTKFGDEWLNRRATKTGKGKLQQINQLAPKERALIAFIRSNPQEVFEDILKKYDIA